MDDGGMMTTGDRVPRIAVFGSLNMDVFSFVERAPLPGETVMGLSSSFLPGGKGANQAAACAKLSRYAPSESEEARRANPPLVTVQMMGAVGDDMSGRTMRSTLEDYGVDCSGVKELKDTPTGTAVIVVDASGENRIIVSANANGQCRPEDFPRLPSPRPDLLVLQLETPIDTVVHMIRLARSEGVPVLLNPSPVAKLPDDVYDGLDHLVVNETEARYLLGHEDPGRPFEEDELRGDAETFLRWGVKNVVVTLGSRGVFALDRKGFTASTPAQKPQQGDVVDTTGAGDTFTGAYALGVVLNDWTTSDDQCNHLNYSIRDGAHAAGLAVMKKGAMPAIPYRSEMFDPHVRFNHGLPRESESDPHGDV